MCEEWEKDYLAFEAWAYANGYNENLTIDRIDGAKGYAPWNCRFVDYYTQNNNRSQCNYIKIGDEIKTVSQWAEHYGISKKLATLRYWQGVRGDSLFLPSHKGKKVAK